MFLGVVGSGVQASLRRYDDGSTSNETNPWRNVMYHSLSSLLELFLTQTLNTGQLIL